MLLKICFVSAINALTCIVMAGVVSLGPINAQDTPMTPSASANISRATALLPVKNVDENAVFLEKVGFRRTSEVSEDPADPSTPLGFAIMVSGDVQIMLQSIQSIRNDDPGLLPEGGAQGFMFVEVADLNRVIAVLEGYDVFMERRSTFYGSDEIGIVSPAGHKFTFAQFGTNAESD